MGQPGIRRYPWFQGVICTQAHMNYCPAHGITQIRRATLYVQDINCVIERVLGYYSVKGVKT